VSHVTLLATPERSRADLGVCQQGGAVVGTNNSRLTAPRSDLYPGGAWHGMAGLGTAGTSRSMRSKRRCTTTADGARARQEGSREGCRTPAEPLD
jgi:hypothetical protein